MQKVLTLGLLLSLVGGLPAQHRGGGVRFNVGVPASGGFGHGFGRSPFFVPQQISVNLGIPPVNPIPPLGVNMLGVNTLTPVWPFPGSPVPPLGFGAYPLLPVVGGYDYGSGATPNIIVLQPIQLPPARPEVARPTLREYNPPAGPGAMPAQATAQQATFSLVLRDGTTVPAILVWAQDDSICYVDPAGRMHQIATDALDRDATLRLNRSKNLNIHLPEPR
jgi:hypothetical protein